MALFTINSEKCKKHNHCAVSCPMMIIKINDDGNPVPAEHAAKYCIRCGHCVTVCPEGAFTHRHIDPSQCPPTESTSTMEFKKVEQLFKTRRSIRKFMENPPDRETMMKLLDLARFAPSGKNVQPVHWKVIQSREFLHKMIELVMDWVEHKRESQPEFYQKEGLGHLVTAWDYGKDMICYNAPYVVIAHGDFTDRRANPASIIALAHIELAAHFLGLGACWAGILNYVINDFLPLKTFLGLLEGHQAFGSILIGYPKYQYHRIPLRNEADIDWK